MYDYQCQLRNYEAQTTMCVRKICAAADLPEVLGKIYNDVYNHLDDNGLQPIGAPYVAYFNMDINAIEIEAGYPIKDVISTKDDIIISEIPAGKYATILYIGPYIECGPAYEELTNFISINNLEHTGMVFEFYLNNPDKTEEDMLQTYIMMSVK